MANIDFSHTCTAFMKWPLKVKSISVDVLSLFYHKQIYKNLLVQLSH